MNESEKKRERCCIVHVSRSSESSEMVRDVASSTFPEQMSSKTRKQHLVSDRIRKKRETCCIVGISRMNESGRKERHVASSKSHVRMSSKTNKQHLVSDQIWKRETCCFTNEVKNRDMLLRQCLLMSQLNEEMLHRGGEVRPMKNCANH